MGTRKKRILIIDDQELFRKTTSAQLSALGYAGKGVSNVLAGLKLLRREAFHLVMVDMIMPQIGGLVAIEAIRQEHPEIPILAVSGYYENVSGTVDPAEVDGILPKPITLGVLETTLNKIFSKKRSTSRKGAGCRPSRQNASNQRSTPRHPVA
jgi:CheY-like chemotaxis protein